MQLKVVEGDGAIFRTGARAARALTVLVTDETGKPVERAAVSFRLPDEGPSGVFSSGLRTEVVTTGPDGRATVLGMQWNRTAGPGQIRITAVKDQARAGIIFTQYLSDALASTPAAGLAPKAGGEGTFTASHKGRTKWILIAVAAAGGAAAGVAFSLSHSAAVSPLAAPTGLTIGSPSINVGHP